VARWKGRGKCTEFWWESPKEKDHLEDQGSTYTLPTDYCLVRKTMLTIYVTVPLCCDEQLVNVLILTNFAI
jgi:hypothetical protein